MECRCEAGERLCWKLTSAPTHIAPWGAGHALQWLNQCCSCTAKESTVLAIPCLCPCCCPQPAPVAHPPVPNLLRVLPCCSCDGDHHIGVAQAVPPIVAWQVARLHDADLRRQQQQQRRRRQQQQKEAQTGSGCRPQGVAGCGHVLAVDMQWASQEGRQVGRQAT